MKVQGALETPLLRLHYFMAAYTEPETLFSGGLNIFPKPSCLGLLF